jgi:hypothetical protein
MTMAPNDRARQNHDALFPTRLIDLATQLLLFIGYPRTLNALRAIDEVVLA